MSWNDPNRYDADIASAMATPGGHLHIGRGGFTLHYGHSRLQGYDCDIVKAAAILAGLPVIDSRDAPFDAIAMLVVRGPMIAVNAPPSDRPWHALSYAPLEAVAAAYRRAGAEVRNISESPEHDSVFDALPPGPLDGLINHWLAFVRGEQS